MRDASQAAGGPGLAQRLRQDGLGRVGPRAAWAGRGTARHWRHLSQHRHRRGSGDRSGRLHRVPGTAEWPGQDPAPQGPRRHSRPPRLGRAGAAGPCHRPHRLGGGEPVSVRRHSGSAGLHRAAGHRKHRHRRPGHAALRGQEPPGCAGAGGPVGLRRSAGRAAHRRNRLGAAPPPGPQSLPPHRPIRRRRGALFGSRLGRRARGRACRRAAGCPQAGVRQAHRPEIRGEPPSAGRVLCP